MVICSYCNNAKATLRRPKTGATICRECFYAQFELEIHHTIIDNKLFTRGQRVAVAASGGKDSTVLGHVMSVLNARHDYGLDLYLLSIDEGITGYRDDSLECVKRNEAKYGIPLKIVSYKELYGWTMDEIVKEIGLKNNCTFCGVFRRQALDRGAALLKSDVIVTGHNADDIAETCLMNILRGDIARLGRCVSIITGEGGSMPRCKPFKYTYEKEIVLYAHYKELDYFSTECIYSPYAYRGYAREYLKDLEKAKSRSVIDIIRSAESFNIKVETKKQVLGKCVRCNYMSSNDICKACVLLAGLNRGKPRLAVGRKARGTLEMDDESKDDAKRGTTNTTTASTSPSTPPTSDSSRSGVSGSGVDMAAIEKQRAAAKPPASNTIMFHPHNASADDW